MQSGHTARPGRGWELLLAILAALGAGAAGGYLIAIRAASPTASGAEPAGSRPERVTSLGRLQPAGGVVPVFGPPGDRIAKMYKVHPGDRLEVDTPVAELASRKDRLQELQIAETQQEEAKNSLKFAQLAGQKRLQAAEAEREQARANKASDLAAIDAHLAYLKLQSETAA
jgi:HlyD family secretion protein